MVMTKLLVLSPILIGPQGDRFNLLAANSLIGTGRLSQDTTLITGQAAFDRLCKRINLFLSRKD